MNYTPISSISDIATYESDKDYKIVFINEAEQEVNMSAEEIQLLYKYVSEEGYAVLYNGGSKIALFNECGFELLTEASEYGFFAYNSLTRNCLRQMYGFWSEEAQSIYDSCYHEIIMEYLTDCIMTMILEK